MASEQLSLYDIPDVLKTVDDKKKVRRNWENGFQKWSNEQAMNGDGPYGCCGWGSMCNYCEDNTYGRPCVRALNEMCREKRITIDYSKRNYEDIWGREV